MALILRVTYPTPSLVSAQFVSRIEDGDEMAEAVRGYVQATRAEWGGPAWAAIRAACAKCRTLPTPSRGHSLHPRSEVPMSVRAKVRVESVEYNKNAAGERESARVVARPVYDPDPASENGRFFRWTPGGQIDLQVVNLDAADQFTVGDEFYVDFTKVEKAAPAEPAVS